ncbi:hypothetical protein A5651_19120 [Mycobacterium sp. 1274761.0]|nr:hypothetical protein A5651_19120 [Mycobacterium sp. 1274761.0]
MPMASIAAHLRGCGHDVVLLTGEEHRAYATVRGLAFAPLSSDAHPIESSAPSSMLRLLPALARRYLTGAADVRSTFIAPLVGQQRALAQLVDTDVDAVLVDFAFTGALPLVAAGRPRPCVIVCGVGPLTLSSADTPPFGMAWVPRSGRNYGGMHFVARRVLFRKVHAELNAALNSVSAPGVELSLVDWPRLADRVLQLTVPEFEYPRRDLPGNVEYIGPVLPDPAENFEPPDWWSDALAAHTVVHVTQGTLHNNDHSQLIGPAVRALADMAGVSVIVTTGLRDAPQTLIAAPSNVYVAQWIPYSALLPHVDVMVTNGGYGGVQHALRFGVPLVVAGESSDKAEVGARVEYAGVGVNLGTAHPTEEAIRASVRAAGAHRHAARRLARSIARSAALDRIADVIAEETARQRVSTGWSPA